MPSLSPPPAARVARGRPTSRHYGLIASAAVIVALASAIMLSDASSYYSTSLRVRAYHPAHRLLRPSGTIGQLFGLTGLSMMTMPVLYAARKKLRWLSRAGQMTTWLEVHIFCGIVGPVLVTLHTSFKFNGLVSVAYWSMVSVMLSGFVGRYLFVRIPRTIRGVELSYEEIQAEAAQVRRELEETGLPRVLLERLEDLETKMGAHRRHPVLGALVAPAIYRWQLRRLSATMHSAGLPHSLVTQATRFARDRVHLLRRLQYLDRTRRLFALWHVFHQPLVYLMFAIVALHIALVAYLGYVSFLRW